MGVPVKYQCAGCGCKWNRTNNADLRANTLHFQETDTIRIEVDASQCHEKLRCCPPTKEEE
jgi:hypothetical protein